ncbi:MAG: hypothetical protein JSU64_00715 [candidate division WOR-3 bacterium]|nr:MAG: hypothetical protein JSU64_00715 [candidate division WOR-3 bacterium]UCF05604.1 MAG: hypothetical protein JSV33_00790 [bacterium]
MIIVNRNAVKALKLACRCAISLLTIIFVFMSCSEDSVSPEPSPADQFPVMCISYYDNSNGDLKFSINNDGFWGEPKVVVSSVHDVGQWPSLALDAEGHPHISYYDATRGNLKYVSENNCRCGWDIETIDFVGGIGSYASLALDAEGQPHISYYDGTNGALKYAAKKSGSWIIEIIDNTGTVGTFTSLALDAQRNPHISYCDNGNKDLKYASKTDGYWIIETVDPDGSVGLHTSLALDTQGDPHISYCEQNLGDPSQGTLIGALKYAVRKNGRWECTLIDRANGQFSSLILDDQGNPHISYYTCDMHYRLNQLPFECEFSLSYIPKYAVKIDGYWIQETIDEGYRNLLLRFCCCPSPFDCRCFWSMCTSIALDASGIPYISYYDWANGDLKCAMKVGSHWIVDTIDDEGDVGSYSSLASGHR